MLVEKRGDVGISPGQKVVGAILFPRGVATRLLGKSGVAMVAVGMIHGTNPFVTWNARESSLVAIGPGARETGRFDETEPMHTARQGRKQDHRCPLLARCPMALSTCLAKGLAVVAASRQ